MSDTSSAPGLTERFERLAVRIDELAERDAGRSAELDALRCELAAVGGQVEDLERARVALEQRDGHHEQAMGRLEARVGQLGGQIEAVAQAQGAHAEVLARIERRIPTSPAVIAAGLGAGAPGAVLVVYQIAQALGWLATS